MDVISNAVSSGYDVLINRELTSGNQLLPVRCSADESVTGKQSAFAIAASGYNTWAFVGPDTGAL